MTQAETQVVYRSCNLCEAHCGVAVTVDRAANRVLDIRGDQDDVLSRGYVCPKAIGLRALSGGPGPRARTAPTRRRTSSSRSAGTRPSTGSSRDSSRVRDAHGANAIATYLGNPNAHDFASNLRGARPAARPGHALALLRHQRRPAAQARRRVR